MAATLKPPPGYRDPTKPVHPKPPPRNVVLPPSFPSPPKKRRSCCRICCCMFCVLTAVLLIVILALTAVFYVVFEPRLPLFRLRSVDFPRFSVAVRADGTYLDADSVVRLEARNPNGRLAVTLGRSEMRVSDAEKGVELAWAARGGFVQRAGNVSVVRFAARERNRLVDDAVGARLKARFRSKTMVVQVKVRTRVGVAVGGLRLGSLWVKLVCRDTTLRKLTAGARPKCAINLLNW